MNTIEPEWLVKAQKGDADAFAQIVEAFQRPVYNLCYRMLGDPYEAEDAAQETFLRAFDNLKRYDSQRSFSTWLLSIAAHHCIDQIRKRRYSLLSLDNDEAPYLEPADANPGPETLLRQREEQKRIQQLLATLSSQDRAVVIMFYWYDFSYDEIADALYMTMSAVKSRLHRARLALARTWVVQETQIIAAERTSNEKAQSPAFQ